MAALGDQVEEIAEIPLSYFLALSDQKWSFRSEFKEREREMKRENERKFSVNRHTILCNICVCPLPRFDMSCLVKRSREASKIAFYIHFAAYR